LREADPGVSERRAGDRGGGRTAAGPTSGEARVPVATDQESLTPSWPGKWPGYRHRRGNFEEKETLRCKDRGAHFCVWVLLFLLSGRIFTRRGGVPRLRTMGSREREIARARDIPGTAVPGRKGG
jgi:hypothetical protein